MATNRGRRWKCQKPKPRWPKSRKQVPQMKADERRAQFPGIRMRRLRYHPLVRELVRENRLSPQNFVLPLFVRAGRDGKQEIGSMPGHFQWTSDRLCEEIHAVADLGIAGV